MDQYQKTMSLQNQLQKLNKLFKKWKKKKTKNKTVNNYAKLIQSIKKEYQKLALENDLLKTKLKKLEDKQLTTDLINHHGKQQEFLEEKEKDIPKNKAHIVKASVETLNLNISYQKKKKTTKKYKRYYDHEDDDLNDDVDGASESNEESDNFNDDDDNVTYEKKTNNNTNKKKKKKEISNYLNK